MRNLIASLASLAAFALLSSGSAWALWEKDEQRSNEWAIRESKAFFDSCSKLNRQEVFKRLQRFQDDFVDELADITLDDLKQFKPTSPFLEVGKVLFPEHLPAKFPLRGAYLICSDAYDEFKLAVRADDRKLKLQELDDCFNTAYRTRKPETAKKMIACYQSLKD